MTSAVEIALLSVLVVLELVRLYSQHTLGKVLLAKQHMLDKQAKAIARDSERARREAVGALEESQRVRQDAQALYGRVDRVLADPGLKRVLSGD